MYNDYSNVEDNHPRMLLIYMVPLRCPYALYPSALSVQMANNLEGGKSPQLRPEVLQDLGFTLVAYPLSLLGVSVRAMQTALQGLAMGRPPPPSAMPSFQVWGLRVHLPCILHPELVAIQI